MKSARDSDSNVWIKSNPIKILENVWILSLIFD